MKNKLATISLALAALLNPTDVSSSDRNLEMQLKRLAEIRILITSNPKNYKKEIQTLEDMLDKEKHSSYFILKNGKYNPNNHAMLPNSLIDSVDDICRSYETGWCGACKPTLYGLQAIALKSGNYGSQQGLFVLAYNIKLNLMSMHFYPKTEDGYKKDIIVSEHIDEETMQMKLSECSSGNNDLGRQTQKLIETRRHIKQNPKKYEDEIEKLEGIIGNEHNHFVIKDGVYNPDNKEKIPNHILSDFEGLYINADNKCKLLKATNAIILSDDIPLDEYIGRSYGSHGILLIVHNKKLDYISLSAVEYTPNNSTNSWDYSPIQIIKYEDEAKIKGLLNSCADKPSINNKNFMAYLEELKKYTDQGFKRQFVEDFDGSYFDNLRKEMGSNERLLEVRLLVQKIGAKLQYVRSPIAWLLFNSIDLASYLATDPKQIIKETTEAAILGIAKDILDDPEAFTKDTAREYINESVKSLDEYVGLTERSKGHKLSYMAVLDYIRFSYMQEKGNIANKTLKEIEKKYEQNPDIAMQKAALKGLKDAKDDFYSKYGNKENGGDMEEKEILVSKLKEIMESKKGLKEYPPLRYMLNGFEEHDKIYAEYLKKYTGNVWSKVLANEQIDSQ